VVPVRLTFTVDGAATTVAAFVGDDTLFASIRRVVTTRGLTVELLAYPMLHAGPLAARRTLARAATAIVGPQWTVAPIAAREPAPELVPEPAVGLPLAA
jgi:hypothetical protein